VPPRPQTQDPDRPLSERERDLIRRLLRWEELPPAFKAAITDYVSVNGSLHVSSMPTLKGEEWREVGATGQPAFTGTWVNASGGTATAAFYKDAMGIVHLKGTIKDGALNTSAFTLPEGYRPALGISFGTTANVAFGSLDVNANGTVVPRAGATSFFSINVSFRAA
jgi:hypothetical protein